MNYAAKIDRKRQRNKLINEDRMPQENNFEEEEL